MAGDGDNIYVDFDYQNIIMVDPNKVVDSDGNVKDRLVKHEELVMYANLECSVPPRTKLSLGAANGDEVRNVSIGKINFLNPGGKGVLDNSYTDEITGENTLQKDGRGNYMGVNQSVKNSISRPDKPDEFYTTQTKFSNGGLGATDNGLLGITSINVLYNTSFMPIISITLEDVKGRALFESGNNSPYAAFFNLPYPMFYLTLKGFYGKAVRYPLMLQNFHAKMDPGSGNFIVNLKFYTYKYTILSEITMGAIQAVPHMYNSVLTLPKKPSIGGSNTTTTEEYNVSKGYQKVIELYNEYKSKGLIEDNFPTLTVQQLQKKLDNFIQTVLDDFRKQNFTPLTDAEKYAKDLKDYTNAVYYTPNDSWFNKHMDTKNYIVVKNPLNPIEKYKVYSFKAEFSGNENLRVDELLSLCKTYNDILNSNVTFGLGSTYEIDNDKKSYGLAPTKINDFTTEVDFNDVDLDQTYRQQYNASPYSADGKTETVGFTQFKTQLETSFKVSDNQILVIAPDNAIEQKKKTYYYFSGKVNGKDAFLERINNIGKNLSVKVESVKDDLANELSKILKDPVRGIGFKPTIRNILAVLFANGEAYLRLLDDVHTAAWEQRNNPIRKDAVFSTNSTSGGDINFQTVEQSPVYPWPQFTVENTANGNTTYEIKYIGDKDYSDKTKAYQYDSWPEVEFVEEFIRGLSLRGTSPSNPDIYNNPILQSPYISLNAIEYPVTNETYQNKEEVKFFYEIWERLSFIANYANLSRGDSNSKQIYDLIAETEKTNIINSLGGTNPFLIKKLKEYKLNASNFESVLQHISNEGVGESWQRHIRGYYITPYIENLTQNDFSLKTFNEGTAQSTQNTLQFEDNIIQYATGTSINQLIDVDIYPFSNLSWCKNNISNGNVINDVNSANSTQKVVGYNTSKKVMTNYNESDNSFTKRPISNFNYVSQTNPTFLLTEPYTNDNLTELYTNRYLKYSEQNPTEGTIKYNNYLGLISENQTTSIFNTPYFVNSIQDGVDKFRQGDTHPFVSSAYLFLNSLPLSTLRERYKTYTSEVGQASKTDDLDFIFATFKKFNALHKIPYAWVLKYGSVWHRYKKWIETSTDILSNVWSDFDYVGNYDPTTGLKTKQYNLTINGVPKTIVLQSDTTSGVYNRTDINVGFYPKVLNDFSVFFKGTQLFTGYTDADIQASLSSGLTITNELPYANLSQPPGVDSNDLFRQININSWSAYLTTRENGVFPLPSLGSTFNQSFNESFSSSTSQNDKMVFEVKDNQSMYNGSVRLFWPSPNYGYFDNQILTIPTPDKYMKTIFIGDTDGQENFSINGTGDYSDISEIFSVFKKEILDEFESEFLKFSMSIYDTEILETTASDTTYKNYQALIRKMLNIPKTNGINESQIITDFQKQLGENVQTYVKNFLSYDYVLNLGNPTNFNKIIFTSFSNIPIVDPYQYNTYTVNSPNTLPYNNGVTFAQSKLSNPDAWKALELYVGFSNIKELAYEGNGSYITDFFVENNVEFSEDNAIKLAPLIKIYATQKLKESTFNNNSLLSLMTDYLNSNVKFQNDILNSLMTKLTKELPNINESPIREVNSVLEGEQTKVELWESFKATNDKWVAGTNLTYKTLFEDMLFLDRANRDIGNEVFVDIMYVNSLLSDIPTNHNLMNYVNDLIGKSHFIIFTYPAYINFYNIQSPVKNPQPKFEGTSEFANTMFGTHLNVDLRESSPKMVCLYGGMPSSHLANESNVDNFKNDAFDLKRASQNPVLQDLTNKNDWDKSNKVVGFNVDFGTINQGVFTSIDVSQDNGLATSESIRMLNEMANAGGNRKSSTQNVSLYDLYKTRSYKCKVSMMGNALIQPTMYFNLRNVPMFYGPYFITEVNHSIVAGSFTTDFTGTRQSIYSLPKIDNYLQTLKETVINVLEKQNKIPKVQSDSSTATNVVDQSAKAVSNTQNNLTVSDTATCTANTNYSQFTIDTTPKDTKIGIFKVKQFIDTIMIGLTPVEEDKMLRAIFTIMGQKSLNDLDFKAKEHNYALVPLDGNIDYGAGGNSRLKGGFYCMTDTQSKQTPYATFNGYEDHITFIYERIKGRISAINDDLSNETLTKFYLNSWPIISNTYDGLSDEQKGELIERTNKIINKLKQIE
jgi:hypothetical protein